MLSLERLGYCCINIELSMQSVMTNRGCIRKTFASKGLHHVGQLALANCHDLYKILEWNAAHSIFVYRMSSSIIPWFSEYTLSQLPQYAEIRQVLEHCGNFAKLHNMRLSFHPGHFNVLASPNTASVSKTVHELNVHAEIMDLMQLKQSYDYPINIHCNGVYGNKHETLKRWYTNWHLLSESAKRRVVVENDDKLNMYIVIDLYNVVHNELGVPITFDYHHHRFNNGGLSEYDAFALAVTTWSNSGTTPLFHYSSCKRTFENANVKLVAHADYIYERINTYNYVVDIELEAKAKEQALLSYRVCKQRNQLLSQYMPFDMQQSSLVLL